MKNFILLFIIVFTAFGCSSDQPKQKTSNLTLVEGSWLLNFQLDATNSIPTKFNLTHQEGNYQLEFINAEETIVIKSVEINDNNIIIKDPVFNTWFEGKIINESLIEGFWYKNDKNYKIAFKAHHSANNRFPEPAQLIPSGNNISGKWEVDFSKNNSADHYKSIGQFKQDGNYLTGTFMTETGDYRFLEGNFYNDSAYLSCYDGAHLFLFKAQFKNDSLYGTFWSGTHWEEPWVAGRNDSFELTNPDSLTFLKEGYDRLAFSFPNLNGENVSLTDEKYQNKVVIVNIMGPWCPNCKDETAYLTQLFNKENKKGLEVIALSFDKSEDYESAKQTALKIKEHFGVKYDILIAGKASKIDAAKALPMLNHIMSYPTSIFIDKQGNIRKIRTGFYGPGTGEFYTRYIEQTDDFVSKLLAE
ncbi:MAG: TlpA disulfide reductase family protein [Vicingaceae bacterium]|nr:TlpA disulfide reductase family protein [Vicingaceae bacterium]